MQKYLLLIPGACFRIYFWTVANFLFIICKTLDFSGFCILFEVWDQFPFIAISITQRIKRIFEKNTKNFSGSCLIWQSSEKIKRIPSSRHFTHSMHFEILKMENFRKRKSRADDDNKMRKSWDGSVAIAIFIKVKKVWKSCRSICCNYLFTHMNENLFIFLRNKCNVRVGWSGRLLLFSFSYIKMHIWMD
jgi:hypothetical protein